MAIYDTSTVGSISGSIGGNTYTRTGRIQQRPRSRNKNTGRQSAVRSGFSTVINQWRDLSASEQLAWSQATGNYPQINRLGKTFLLSGFNLFAKVAMNAALVSQPSPTAPPTPVNVPSILLTSFAPNITTGTMFVSFTPAALGASYVVIIYATPPISNGISRPSASMYKLLGGAPFLFPSPFDFLSFYISKFDPATISVGSRIFLKANLIYLPTFQASPFSLISAVVV